METPLRLDHDDANGRGRRAADWLNLAALNRYPGLRIALSDPESAGYPISWSGQIQSQPA